MLACITIDRMYNYGSYTLDITGPLMVMNAESDQTLRTAYSDGFNANVKRNSTPTQRYQAVKKMPDDVLEYFSYVLPFFKR